MAGPNLKPIEDLICERTSLPSLTFGTLNITLPERYTAQADHVIDAHEYPGGEILKLQRCRIRGLRCYIMRPHTHEVEGSDRWSVIEILSQHPLRSFLKVSDGDEVEVEVEGDSDWWEADPRSD